MLTRIITWVLSQLGGGLLDKVLDGITKVSSDKVRDHEIDADVVKDAMKQLVEAHKIESTKWSFPWFPLMAAPFIMSIGLFFMTLTAYNIFWHSDGIWPQSWTIAAYPGVYQEWATQAFTWVFAPALGVATVTKLFGRR